MDFFTHRMKQGPFGSLYDEAGLPGEIRKSLNYIFIGNLFGNICGQITGSGTPAMVGLASSLGANDLAFGIIAAVMQAAALMQLPFSILVNRTHKRKKYMMTLGVASRAIFLVFGFIPMILPMNPSWLRLYSLIFLLGISSCMGAVINVCWFPWFSDLSPVSIRSRWLSQRDMIMAGINVLVGLGTARILDTLPPESRYIVIFLLGGAAGVMDMVCFAFCREVYTAPPKRLHIREVMKDLVRNKPFVRFLLMWTAWCFTANMGGVYMTPYSMNVMGLTATDIVLFATIASAVSTILVIRQWGKVMFRFGCRTVMAVTCVAASLTPLFYLFSSPHNIWPTLLHNFLGAAFWCGSTLAATSMQLSASPDDTRPTYVAVFSLVTALFGATLGSLSGGAVLHFMESRNLFTGAFDRYKMLFLMEVVLRLGFVLLLVPRLENDRDKTVKDFFLSLIPKRTSNS